MKVLIKIEKNPEKLFLVEFRGRALIKEIATLSGKGKHSKAIVTALSKGKFIKEVAEQDMPHIDADLILTEKHAHWDYPNRPASDVI